MKKMELYRRGMSALRWSIAVVVIALPSGIGVHAQEAKCGLMVMAHGGGDQWNDAVNEAVGPLRDQIPVSIAFGMANPSTMATSVQELQRQGAACIAVVRLFVSSKSFLHQTEYLLGLREDAPRFFVTMPGHGSGHKPRPIAVNLPVDINREGLMDAPQMGSILAERALALRDSTKEEAVIVIAHGPGDDKENEMWLTRLDGLADSIRVTGLFSEVQVHTLREDWKEKRAEAEDRIRAFVTTHSGGDSQVIVLPFRLYGFGPYADVLEGLDYKAAGKGLLPNAHVTDWIRSQYVKTIAAMPMTHTDQ